MNKIDKVKMNIYRAIRNRLVQDSIEEIVDGLTSSDDTIALCRKLAAEGCVLLKNEKVLPINMEEPVSFFGRCQFNYFYVGYGSGGDVKAPYKISPAMAIKESELNYNKKLYDLYETWTKANVPDDGFWGHWPTNYDEMPLSIYDVKEAAEFSKKAVVFIGRSAGEDRESTTTPGSWYLTDAEEDMLNKVCAYFDKVCVVLNCGSIFDTSWIEKYNIASVLYSWQGGQESGNALLDVLTGKVNPSGKLTDTIAKLDAYPSTNNFGDKKQTIYEEDIYVGYRYFETFDKDSVLYPFGHGLSYTTFSLNSCLVGQNHTEVTVKADVKNTGDVAGKEVIQVYVKAPDGLLGKPSRQLVGFKKTSLIEKGETFSCEISINLQNISSYDDLGKTGNKNCFILEEGQYEIFVGTDIRNAVSVGCVELEETVLRKTVEAMPPQKSFTRMVKKGEAIAREQVPAGTRNLKERIKIDIPVPMHKTSDMGYKLADVKSGKVSMNDFVAQLNNEELECLSRGSLESMNSSYGPTGNAGCFGGTMQYLMPKGVPAICPKDGPSGIRLQAHSTLFPIGAVFASSFDPALIAKVCECFGKEVKDRGSQVLLAPGMNIHRHPLCGRNFEYFSEDPYLTGVLSTAFVNGIQKGGAAATIKHMVCNNQETGRSINDAVVSQRALREIYIRGFEICVREANPDCIMTSYNKINGVYSYHSYDLCTTIIRKEMGYEGVIMTDWWCKKGKSPDFKNVYDQAYRLRAGNNVFMPGAPLGGQKGKKDDSIEKSLAADDGISLGELQRNAKIVLKLCMKYI